MDGLYLDMDRLPVYLYAGYRVFAVGERHVDRVADFDVLVLVMEGELAFLEEGREVRLTSGEWYIQRAGLRQEGIPAVQPPRYYFLHFYGQFGLVSPHALPLRGSFSQEQARVEYTRLSIAEHNAASAIEKAACFLRILVMLGKTHQQAHNPKVAQIRDYILQHYQEQLQVKALAARFFFTEDYIIRLFKKHMGITLHQYIRKVRLEHAKQLILSTAQTIDSIAAQTGFPDSASLYRAFVQDTGASPGAWRKRYY